MFLFSTGELTFVTLKTGLFNNDPLCTEVIMKAHSLQEFGLF
jgi:hypothetical protein